MVEYSYKDIIIDPEEERVEVGAYYFFGDCAREVLRNTLIQTSTKLEAIHTDSNLPFDDGNCCYVCVIKDKEAKETVKLYDFSDSDCRADLLGEAIQSKEEECDLQGAVITGFTMEMKAGGEKEWLCWFNGLHSCTAQELYDNWEFVDGTPCALKVME